SSAYNTAIPPAATAPFESITARTSAGPAPAILLFSPLQPWKGNRMTTPIARPQRMAAGLVVLALALLLAMPAMARQRAPAEPVPSAEGISEFVLVNGMRVVLFPD